MVRNFSTIISLKPAVVINVIVIMMRVLYPHLIISSPSVAIYGNSTTRSLCLKIETSGCVSLYVFLLLFLFSYFFGSTKYWLFNIKDLLIQISSTFDS
jgi:hypothetical protein